MKLLKYIFAVVLLIMTIPSVAQDDNMRPSAVFVSTERIHNFGVIQEKNGKVKHTFLFRNKGRKVVVIDEVSAWCGCTEIDYPKYPIKAGGTAKITVTYNPNRRPGSFSKELVVITDGGRSYTRVWIKGRVVPMEHPVTEDFPYAYGNGLYMTHQVISFPPLKKGEISQFELGVANNTPRPMRLLFRKQPHNRVLRMPDELMLKPKQRLKLRIIYRAPKTYTYNRHITITPFVNGHSAKKFKVTWFGN